MTRARNLIRGATFEPADIKILTYVFEEVWSSIAPNYGSDPRVVEEARLKLATIVLDLAKDGQLGPIQITRTSARLMRETGVEIKPTMSPDRHPTRISRASKS